jgi:hypothetical protein
VAKLLAAVDELKTLPDAHNVLDKHVAVGLARLDERLAALERKPAAPATTSVAPVTAREEVLNIKIEDEFKPMGKTAPKRDKDMAVQMPASKEVF